MFKKPFSFEGRIRRTEYGCSLFLYTLLLIILNAMIENSQKDESSLLGLLYIPLLWFLWAQGAKRCHDVGNSGWWQIVPIYVFWMLFQEGNRLSNKYGQNPKQPVVNSLSVSAEPIESIRPDKTEQAASGQPSIALEKEHAHDINITELEIHQVNYGLLQETLRILRSIKSVQAISYEFDGTIGKAMIKHGNSSQDLLGELYGIAQGIEVLALAPGFIKLKLK